MKRLFLTLLILMFAFPAIAQEPEVYGAGITLAEKTEISAILAEPTAYVGKRVLVEGKVLDVCKHAGCWMELAGSNEDEMIRVKVKDGDIVFPVEAAGQLARVEGEVYAIELDQEEAIEFYQHFAEDAEKEFDPSTVTGPVTIYQIKGLGAEIKLSETAPNLKIE